jgi:hypothetical protein
MPVGGMEASNFKLFLPLSKRPANYATAFGLSQSPLGRNLRRNLRNLRQFFIELWLKLVLIMSKTIDNEDTRAIADL